MTEKNHWNLTFTFKLNFGGVMSLGVMVVVWMVGLPPTKTHGQEAPLGGSSLVYLVCENSFVDEEV